MKIRVSTRGRIVLPAEIRRRDGIRAGEELDVERLGSGEYRLVHVARPRDYGLLDWLLACPEKGYFVPIESAATGTL